MAVLACCFVIIQACCQLRMTIIMNDILYHVMWIMTPDSELASPFEWRLVRQFARQLVVA